MKAISFIKNNAIAMSIALAAVIGFSAFKIGDQPTELVWFERIAPNQYQLMDDGEPSQDPSNGCGTTVTTLCAKGFPQNAIPNEEDITDTTIASNRYHPAP